MIRVRNTLAVLAFATLFGCTVESPASTPTTDQMNLTLHTTYATQPLTRDLTQYYMDSRPEFLFETVGNSYGRLMAQLRDETIDYFISRYVPIDDNIWAAPIAQDGLILIVHPDNPIHNLSIDTIREIFGGKQTEWQPLNGQSDAIVTLTYPSNDDVYHEFHHLIMGWQRITSNAQVVPNIAAMIQEINNTPNAIGYIPLSHVSDAIQVLAIDDVYPTQSTIEDHIYPLRTTLFVIGREEPPPIYRTFVSWVQSGDGQAIVSQTYSPLP